jgi:hypothetical protein
MPSAEVAQLALEVRRILAGERGCQQRRVAFTVAAVARGAAREQRLAIGGERGVAAQQQQDARSTRQARFSAAQFGAAAGEARREEEVVALTRSRTTANVRTWRDFVSWRR